MKARSFVVAFAIVATPALSSAQDATAPVAVNVVTGQSGCELHVWPSEGLGSVRQTDSGSGIIGLVASNSANKGIRTKTAQNNPDAAAPDAPLSPVKQRALLTVAPLATLLDLPDYRVVIHDAALDSHTVRTVKTRYQPSESPCYADLVIDDTTFTAAGINGSGLRSFIRYRRFGADPAPTLTYGTWVVTNLKKFTPATASPDAVALAELDAAFDNNLKQFGKFLHKPVKKK